MGEGSSETLGHVCSGEVGGVGGVDFDQILEGRDSSGCWEAERNNKPILTTINILLCSSNRCESTRDTHAQQTVADRAPSRKDSSWHQIHRHTLIDHIVSKNITSKRYGRCDSWRNGGTDETVSVAEGATRCAGGTEIVAWA